ncbi:MAG: S46 family peptidase, partial [Polyangia bacterium]
MQRHQSWNWISPGRWRRLAAQPLALAAVIAAGLAPPVVADEGMWTFDRFPAAQVKQKYDFFPEQAWLDHLRLAAVRIAGGCSASLVSPEGLVMTNHHCSHSCIEQLSNAKKDYVKAGFYARELADEVKCPAMEVDQLVEISDVTQVVESATKGVADAKFFDAQKATLSDLEKACSGGSDEIRCEVVSLYQGGRFDLYRYRRYQDVRLVFAPELQIAFFGGDPDNFMFPRYDLDVSFLRIYGRDGKPAKTPDFLAWSSTSAKAGDLAFVAGNPGATSRLFTVAQLQLERDVVLPEMIARLSEVRGLLTEYQHRGAEQRRTSGTRLFYVENALKALKGRHQALADATFLDAAVKAEQAFKDKVDANPAWKEQYGAAWAGIAAAVDRQRQQERSFVALERGFRLSDAFGIARTLVRAADELGKPNRERLSELADARLPQLKQRLFSKAPIYDELEIAMLSFSLSKL